MSLRVKFWLAVSAVLQLMILVKVSDIAKRTRERFPTEKEQDYDWAKSGPMGHWEAHGNDKKAKR
jgi:hypothetical protein